MIGKPVGDFLAALSAKTGVKMTARQDVADDKLALFVKDLPLSGLQKAIKKSAPRSAYKGRTNPANGSTSSGWT